MKLFSLSILAVALLPAPALADRSCADGYNDTETYILEGADLALHSGVPDTWKAYGKAACIFYSDPSLEEFRYKVETSFRRKLEKNFSKHLKLGQPKLDLECKFDSVDNLAGAASFDDIEGDTPLDRELDKKDCYGDLKLKHFAYVKIPFAEASVKMRCGKAEFMKEWADACSREPSSVKPKKKI